MRHRSGNVSSRFGLSLVEVLVAISILGVLSAAIVSLLPGLTRTSVAANEDVESTQIIQSMFERLQEAWADPTSAVWSEDPSGNVWSPTTMLAQADARLASELISVGLDDLCGASSSTLSTVVDGSPVVYGLQVAVRCQAVGSLPARTLMRGYGDPR